MKLERGSSQEIINRNVAELMRTGSTRDEASAIAYKEAGKDAFLNTESARKIDNNGYVVIEKNPISRAGVFPYLGKSIGAPDANRIYNVYRPAEELADPDCIESFKLMPLVDDHAMLGPEVDGFIPAENKGVHGTTGDRVTFENNVLYANLKIFSDFLNDMIKRGKKGLSLGYRCIYEKASGVCNGQAYEYVQRQLRGNHIALVDEPRCAVEVLDHQLAFDHFDLTLDNMENKKMAEETKGEETKKEMTLSEVTSLLEKVVPQIEKLTAAMSGAKGDDDEMAVDGKVTPSTKPGVDEDEEKKDEKKKAEDEEEYKKNEEDKKGMDQAITKLSGDIESIKKNGIKSMLTEITSRNALADRLSSHIGTFDASEMTLDEVAGYGVAKLSLPCPKGHEKVALDAYLHNRQARATSNVFALDSGVRKGGKFDAFLKKNSAA